MARTSVNKNRLSEYIGEEKFPYKNEAKIAMAATHGRVTILIIGLKVIIKPFTMPVIVSP
jgi:hypothetical protein